MVKRDKASCNDKLVLETLLWYFSTAANGNANQTLETNKKYAVELGRMIAELPFMGICTSHLTCSGNLSFGGSYGFHMIQGWYPRKVINFNATIEYELVGSGLLDPFHSQNMKRLACLEDVISMSDKIIDGRLLNRPIKSDNLRSLAPFILLLLHKHRNLLEDKALIKFDLECGDVGFLSTNGNIGSLDNNAKKQIFTHYLQPILDIFIRNLNLACKVSPKEKLIADEQTTLVGLLTQYYNYRESIKNEYYHFFRKTFGGFSRTEKLDAARTLIQAIEKPGSVVLTQEHRKALNNGQLKDVIKKWEKTSGQSLDNILRTEEIDCQPRV